MLTKPVAQQLVNSLRVLGWHAVVEQKGDVYEVRVHGRESDACYPAVLPL